MLKEKPQKPQTGIPRYFSFYKAFGTLKTGTLTWELQTDFMETESTCEIARTALICPSSFLKQLVPEWGESLFVSVFQTSVSGKCWKMSLIPVSESQYILFLQFPLNSLFRRGGSRSQVIKLPDSKAYLDALVVHSVELSVTEEGVTATHLWPCTHSCW